MSKDGSLGVLMLDLVGLQLSPDEQRMLQRPEVGGVILFSRNFASVSQLQSLVGAIRACQPALLIAVDQEGGRVQRFKDGFTRLPAMHSFGLLHGKDPQLALDLAQTCGWLMAAELLGCGVDFSFAPVLDLYRASSRVIADRAFAADAHVATELARAFIHGMHSAGMKATGKHFPGHGTVEADSHTEIPVDDRSAAVIAAADLIPFAQCSKLLDAVMPAHVIYPQVDSQCAGFSRKWLQEILRGELAFTGVIFSDDLTMAAAETAGTIEQRADAALQAGCDMLLVCNQPLQARSIADWLLANATPRSSKLAAMRGVAAMGYQALLASSQWQQARERLAPLMIKQ